MTALAIQRLVLREVAADLRGRSGGNVGCWWGSGHSGQAALFLADHTAEWPRGGW